MDYLTFELVGVVSDAFVEWLKTKAPWFFAGLLIGFSPSLYAYLVQHLSIHWK